MWIVVFAFFFKKQNGFKSCGDNFMCKKLEELSRLKIEDLYDLFDDEFASPPVNIHKILDLLGVEYNAVDFRQLKGEINGITLPDQAEMVMGAVAARSVAEHGKDSVEITVNVHDNYHRQRFTLAHELAHCMLHADSLKHGRLELRTSMTTEETREREANILAGEILIPEKLLKIACAKLPIPILEILADCFDVSENVMAARLDYLQMGYYKL